MSPVLLCLVVLFALQHVTLTASQNQEARVRAHVFRDYDPKVRPVIDASEPVDVKLGVAFTNLLDLNLVSGVATLNVWLRATWYDPNLDWNSSEFGGLWQFTAGVQEVWTPDFLAYNHVERFEKEIRHEDTKLYIYADGWGVFWSRPAVVRLALHVDSQMFPFDTQECEFRMGSWSNSGLLQNLSIWSYTRSAPSKPEGKERVTNGEVDMSNFIGSSSEFEITTRAATRTIFYYACCPTEPWPIITFYLHMKRKPAYYIKNIILPTMITTAMSFSTFALPHECGERLGLGITCMLVICAIMFVSSDLVPITEGGTVLGTIYTGCFAYSLLALLVTVVTAFLLGQTGDGDHDGEKGTWVVTNLCGISPRKAAQASFAIDTICGVLCPVSFSCLCAITLNPAWSMGTQIGVAILIIIGSFGLIGLGFALVYLVRKNLGYNVQGFSRIFHVRKSRVLEIGVVPCGNDRAAGA